LETAPLLAVGSWPGINPYQAATLTWCVAQGADGKGLGSGLGCALKALSLPLDVDCHLQGTTEHTQQWDEQMTASATAGTP
jgi:hypothetical protein